MVEWAAWCCGADLPLPVPEPRRRPRARREDRHHTLHRQGPPAGRLQQPPSRSLENSSGADPEFVSLGLWFGRLETSAGVLCRPRAQLPATWRRLPCSRAAGRTLCGSDPWIGSDGTLFSLDSLPCVVQKAWSCLSSLLPRRTESWKLQQRGLGQPAALRKPQPARSVVLMNRKERWSAWSELLFCLKCGISCFFGNAGLCSRRCYWTRWEVCSAVCCSPSRAKFSALDWE